MIHSGVLAKYLDLFKLYVVFLLQGSEVICGSVWLGQQRMWNPLLESSDTVCMLCDQFRGSG